TNRSTTPLRSAPGAGAGALPALAARSNGRAGADAPAQPGDPVRRLFRPHAGAEEPGGGPALGPLAGIRRPRPAGRGQPLLLCLPLHAPAPAGEAAAPREPRLAELVARQVARGRRPRRLLLGL